MAGAEFVDGWFVAGVLGEGAYGEVRLLVHGRSRAQVALKAVRGAAGAREAALHAALRHPHVLRLLGTRTHAPADVTYLFLEWARGGELFQRIEPDAGMGEAEARRYWRQLLAAASYLHGRGVAHRDFKPENLLLSADGRLLVADFGLATLFRAGGRERLLTRAAGTPPYAAPEVAAAADAPYRAAPADLWSAAIVLVAMLVGELPWERASMEEARYAAWVSGGGGGGAGGGGVWRRVPAGALALLRRALHAAPAQRYTLEQLVAHPWTKAGGELDTAESDTTDGAGLWASQPLPHAAALPGGGELASLSQPAGGGAPALATAAGARLWLAGGAGAALRAAAGAATARGWTWARRGRALLLDAGGATLRLCVLARTPGAALLEARRAAGCGLQFRRRWAELRAALLPLTAAEPPATDYLATNHTDDVDMDADS